MKRLVQALLTLALLGATSLVQAATYYVATNGSDSNSGTQAQPFKTIQKGIDTAVNGDTVRVGNGTYKGAGNKNLDFGGKNFTLKSLGGAANCIIDCEQNGRGFTFHGAETAQAVVDGFTIANGSASSASGGGISCDSSSPTVTNCTFSGNTASSGGGGMYNKNSNPTLTNCTFTGNTATSYGGGIYNSDSSNPTVTNCTFSGNYSGQGGGMFSLGSSPTVTNCTFAGNRADGGGGGMAFSASNPTVTRCTFTGNSADQGGAMFNIGAIPTLTYCLFIGNSASQVGGGMSNTNSSTPILTNCIFAGNRAGSSGGGMYFLYGNSPLTNCTFTGNTARFGGGVYNAGNESLTVTNCIFWGDAGGEMGGNPAILSYSNIGGYPATPQAPDSNHNFGADPRFVRPPSPGADGQWGTADDDFGDLRLQADSPCINAGNAAAPNLPLYDMQVFVRIADSAPDQGAYEFGSTPYIAADLYVDKVSGNDITGNGTSAAPFKTVNKALSMVSTPIGLTAIHVKAGNYGSDRPQVTKRVRFVNWGNTGQARIGKP